MDFWVSTKFLKQILITDESIEDLSKLLTSHSATVEKTKQVGDDTIWQLEITPNRVDMVSYIGLARELYAIIKSKGGRAKLKNHLIGESVEKFNPQTKVIHEDNLIIQYALARFKNIKVGKSDSETQELLEKSNIRAINNLVDISNIIMLECGHPMHIFDAKAFSSDEINFRKSLEGEKVTLLDKKELAIPEGSIVLEEKGELIDLCGVMGGLSSGVTNDTNEALLWIPIYNPENIRNTTRKLHVFSDASKIYEKNVSLDSTSYALQRAIILMKKYFPESELVEIDSNYLSSEDIKVKISHAELTNCIGMDVCLDDAAGYLENLGFIVERNFEEINCIVPKFREYDVSIPQDLVEEVSRIVGLEKLNGTLPTPIFIADSGDKIVIIENKLKSSLVADGFLECYSQTFSSVENIVNTGFEIGSCMSVNNPLSEDTRFLRPSLFVNLLPAFAKNLVWESELGMFEAERVHALADRLGEEDFHLSGAISIKELDACGIFYACKKAVISALMNAKFDADGVSVEKSLLPNFLHPLRSGGLRVDGNIIGFFGLLHPKIARNFGISNDVAVFDLSLSMLGNLKKSTKIAKNVSNFTPVTINQTLTIEKNQKLGPELEMLRNKIKAKLERGVGFDFEIKSCDTQENQKTAIVAVSFMSDSRQLSVTDAKGFI